LSRLAQGSTLCEGRYRLEEVVGRGGMAIVWRARDLQLERDVAIKVISDLLAGDERFLARFEREARLAAGLNHPNLVKLFDYSIEDERPFLVMEYVPGGTLAQARSATGADDAAGAIDPVELAREILDALAHIHGAGIVHRDVKPANVLLDAAGSPRLTDFGIARSEEQSNLTMTGQVLGTLKYIAPEVAAGQPATVRSDLYSLGMLLGEVAGDPSPPELAGLLARMTAREPSERPASAADALAELSPTRALPATGSPPTPAPHIRVRIGRGQLIAAAAVLVALLTIVIAAALDDGSSDLERAATAPSPAPAGAPVDRQIDRLEQIVRDARAR
jgi:serine/threonine protein kinase